MKVIAAAGLKVPKEGNPREYITDAEPVEIDALTHYYQCRLADNELVEVTDAKKATGSSKAGPDAASK